MEWLWEMNRKWGKMEDQQGNNSGIWAADLQFHWKCKGKRGWGFWLHPRQGGSSARGSLKSNILLQSWEWGEKEKKEKGKNIHKSKLWGLAILRFPALFVLLCLYYIYNTNACKFVLFLGDIQRCLNLFSWACLRALSYVEGSVKNVTSTAEVIQLVVVSHCMQYMFMHKSWNSSGNNCQEIIRFRVL